MKISVKSLYDWYRSAVRNPKYRWWIILGSLVYVLSPFDISPDLFPVIGEIDDLMVVTLLVSEVSQSVLDYFKNRHGKSSSSTNATDPKDETIEVESVSVK